MNAIITIKNYRCFSDESPATIKIGDGFTALVGPNGSGKSTLLRMLYDLRSIFRVLSESSNIADQIVRSGMVAMPQAPPVADATEFFHKGNSRDAQIEILVPEVQWKGTAHDTALEIVVTIFRSSPWKYKVDIKNREKIVRGLRLDKQGDNLVIARDSAVGMVSLIELADVCKSLSRTIYVGSFRNTLNLGSSSYYDLSIGDSFIKEWDTFKTSPGNRRNNEAAERVEGQIAGIFGFDRFSINASPDKRSLQVLVNGRSYPLEDMGSGLTQFIIVLASTAMNQPDILLIDEPELNLHPSLQLDFLTTVTSYTKIGVVFATHSLGLARSSGGEIFSIRRVVGERSEVRKFEDARWLPELLGELSYSGYSDLGFKRVLLVEGSTEVKTALQFLRFLRKEHSVALLSLGGSDMIKADSSLEMSEFSRIASDVAVLIDSERSVAGEPLSAEREAFVANCIKLGYKIHVLERRSIENYLSDRAVKESEGENLRALAPFEDFKSMNPRWSKTRNWRIANLMTRDELLATDLGRFLEEI